MSGRILYWGDPPTIRTGFGVVARHVLRALHGAGHQINCLATNATTDFPDPALFPYAIAPVMPSPHDRVGALVFAHFLAVPERRPDLVLVQNDLSTTHSAAALIASLRERKMAVPPIVHYFPVDCAVRRDFAGMLSVADVNVTCTTFGRLETTKAFPDRVPLVIPHGVDTRSFHPLAEGSEARAAIRRAMGVSPDTLLVCTVAANSVRKDLPRTIAACAELPRVLGRPVALYLHTLPFSNGIDLNAAAAACGLVVGRDVIFPPGYHPLAGVTDAAMNDLYGACDLYFTTTLGEGWGLPITEAMAAGLPVVAPHHTSLAELGADGRAVLYECRDRVWVDNSGYRPSAPMDDIVAALVRAATMSPEERARLVGAALAFARRLDWSNVAPRWVSLIGDVMTASARGSGQEPSLPGSPAA